MTKNIIEMNNILKLDGEAFVYEAYRLILNREPDFEGLVHYLSHLELSNDKVFILRAIYDSAERKEKKQKSKFIEAIIRKQSRLSVLKYRSTAYNRKLYAEKLRKISELYFTSSINDSRRVRPTTGAETIKNSESVITSFDPVYYLEENQDVLLAGINPYEHFFSQGYFENRKYARSVFLPSPEIKTEGVTKVERPSKVNPELDLFLDDDKLKTVCFYLPQFHAIPENDKWWGMGFTEWTNVKPAKPQFIGHNQPRIPGELGYYDLSDNATFKKQIELAKSHNIHGFCFYYYWFGGKRLLEKPVENYLKDKTLDLQYCLCWANENWSRRWDGLDSDILISQNHSPLDDIDFIKSISVHFSDDRYIKVDGKPLLIVYRPSLLPDPLATVERWRMWVMKNLNTEIYLAYTQSFDKVNPSEFGFDGAIEFPPNNSDIPDLTQTFIPSSANISSKVYDWTELVRRSENYVLPEYDLMRGCCPDWDNTARKKNNASILHHSSPHQFQRWYFNALVDTKKRESVNSNGLVFINAWNEWAEGAYLEPDERLGYANLEACKMARLRAEIVKGNVEKKLTNSTLAIIVHVFYVDVFEEIIAYINKLKGNIKLYVTCQSANHAQTAALLKAQSHEFNLTVNDNHGRDVLPFLFVLNEIIKNKHQYFVKVHTKKSEHRSDGNAWRSQLFKDLLTQKTLNRNLARFNSQRLLGILVPTDHIVPMTFYLGSNEEKVLQLSHRLGVCADELLSLHFAAGTMFMARTEALLPLICLGLDGRDFEYEDGQIDGTMAHAVERVISASCYSAGLKIESVNQPTSENYQFANKTNLGYQR